MEEDFSRFLSVKLGLSPLTIRNHRYKLRLFLAYLKDNHLEMTSDSCESYIYYLKEKKLKPATLNVYIDLIVCLDKYYKDRKQPIDLSSGFKRFTIEQRHIELLTVEEIEKLTTTPMHLHHLHPLWEEMDRMYLLLTTFLAYTGCRYQEAQDQMVKNFDITTGKVLIPRSKNGSYRYVYLPLEVLERFKPILKSKAPHELVFTTNKGIKIFDSNFLANLRKRAKQCGINKRVYPHLFRHSFATQCLTDGIPIQSVAVLLGHKDITTTFENYVHLADTTIRKDVYKHSLFKKNTPPQEIVQSIIEMFKSFNLCEDKRFKYKIREADHALYLQLSFK